MHHQPAAKITISDMPAKRKDAFAAVTIEHTKFLVPTICGSKLMDRFSYDARRCFFSFLVNTALLRQRLPKVREMGKGNIGRCGVRDLT